jgi:hypothetical protein
MAARLSKFVIRVRDSVASRPARLLWAVVGFTVGMVFTLLALILLAPAPPQTVSPPPLSSGITVSIDDASLSQVITDGLTQADVPFHVSNIQARILPGEIVYISGDASVSILGPQQLAVTGQLTVLDGRLSMHITRAAIGALALPAPVVSAIEKSLNEQFVQLGGLLVLGGNRYVVTGISTTNGLLTLSLGNH